MTDPSGQHLPNTALPCVWMTAGLVSYKLCDRRLDCERCPFDAALRGRPLSEPAAGPPARDNRRIRPHPRRESRHPERGEARQDAGLERLKSLEIKVLISWPAGGRSLAVRPFRGRRNGPEEVAMRHTKALTTDWLKVGGSVALILVALPMLALAAFVGRGVLLAAALLALVVGLAAFAASPAFRTRLAGWTEPEIFHNGLKLATPYA